MGVARDHTFHKLYTFVRNAENFQRSPVDLCREIFFDGIFVVCTIERVFSEKHLYYCDPNREYVDPMGPNFIFSDQNFRGDVPDRAAAVKQERFRVCVFQISCKPKIDLANLVVLPNVF
jgi:hypothetical protein